ncbi:ER-localized J domain-containing protein 5 [Candida viswanathii]|uniref:ER-localized J domain-containing protein 5 n=1 Tax=Candida viswanathii TaxID=5486 RepID=A0A367Y0K3_9ASCO|nr:ER-localized J domain-containing protein 5 [Candida viswanathii]
MRFIQLLLLLVALVTAAQWSKEDYEIFSLNDKIQQDLGKATTFYTWLNLEKGPKSTQQEITKAYRKLSRTLHPDKFASASKSHKKKANERFQRLSLVGNILRDKSLKRRYDYFYTKGFPKWKGTGYYYSKFRPSVIFTLVILYVLVGVFHFFALKINRKQAYKRIEDLKSLIKNQAWNGSQLPPADGSDRKVVNEANGKEFLVKPDGSVWLLEDDEQHIIDENEINVHPGFKDSLFFKIPAKLWNLVLGKWVPIDTTVEYTKPVNPNQPVADEKKKPVKKKNRGKKVELPNGKVVYSRKK